MEQSSSFDEILNDMRGKKYLEEVPYRIDDFETMQAITDFFLRTNDEFRSYCEDNNCVIEVSKKWELSIS